MQLRAHTRPLHSHKSAGPSRASASCPTSLHCSSGSSPQAPSYERFPTVLAGAISLFPSEVVGGLPHPTTDRTRSSAHTALPSYAVSVILKRDMSPVSVAAGCASAVSQGPLKVVGQNLPAKVPPSFSLIVSPAIGVYTCAASRCVSAP